MGFWYILIFFVFIVGMYGLSRHFGYKCEYVQCVEAGPTKSISAEELNSKSFYTRPIALKDSEGHHIDTFNMIRLLVHGECMKPRGIEDNSQLYAVKIDRNKDLKSQIKTNDILLIYLKDSGKYKIRIFDKYNEDGELNTYCYNDDETRHDSSNPHRAESVLGVVKYLI